jgi:AcrR family transcriptional regulator
MELVDRDGLAALTMRAVARALKVTPMSLYNHVADKAELVDLIAEEIVGGIVSATTNDTAAAGNGDWELRLRAHAHRHFAAWRQHPDFIKAYTDGVSAGPNALRDIEHTMTALHDAGLDDQDAAQAFMMLYHWVVSSLVVAPARPLKASVNGVGAVRGSAADRVNRYFGALPLEEIPNVEATAIYLTGDHIDLGLDIIIAGLKTRVLAHRPDPTAPTGSPTAPLS